MIHHSSYLRQRTRWRATWKDFQARWRGTPNGRVLTVFRNKRGPGWCWCISGDGLAPTFSPQAYRTREQAKAAVLEAAGINEAT
jgi:hypothetical protein